MDYLTWIMISPQPLKILHILPPTSQFFFFCPSICLLPAHQTNFLMYRQALLHAFCSSHSTPHTHICLLAAFWPGSVHSVFSTTQNLCKPCPLSKCPHCTHPVAWVLSPFAEARTHTHKKQIWYNVRRVHILAYIMMIIPPPWLCLILILILPDYIWGSRQSLFIDLIDSSWPILIY